MSRHWFIKILTVAIACYSLSVDMNARTKDKAPSKDGGEEVQRKVGGLQEQQRNVVSSIDFWTTNYGIFGFDVANGKGGTFWPRGLNPANPNQYIFAGGAWFAAQKRTPNKPGEFRKLVTVGYNPQTGQSWMGPGSVLDGPDLQRDAQGINKYRTYFSPEFNTGDGTDLLNPTYPKWPIWDTSPTDTVQFSNYFGTYVHDVADRNRNLHPEGPAFISGEDIFCSYKDTDMSLYEGGAFKRQQEGYPLGLQVEQMIYSWGFGDYADFLFIKYVYIHPQSYPDTLFNCWMSAVMDVDIATSANSRTGAANDRARYYEPEDSLNLAVQWSESLQGEAGRHFGYLGFNFLESPAVEPSGFIRKDKKKYPVSEQLGLRTMRNWAITVDPQLNEERYDFMAAGRKDGDDAAGDRRLLMATGPFHMRPGDSARIVVGVILAATAAGKDATGTDADMTELIRKVRFAQTVYNNNFEAPRPPDNTIIKGIADAQAPATFPAAGWLGLNNAVAIQWDSTAELSIDTLERGLDFMGYRIYRARRAELDTFNVEDIPSQRKSPLAWKQLAMFSMSPAFFKNQNVTIPNSPLQLDLFTLVEPITSSDREILVRRFGSSGEPWSKYFGDLRNARSANHQIARQTNGKIDLSTFDKLDSIEFTYYTLGLDSLPRVSLAGGVLDAAQAQIATDSLIKLILARRVKETPLKFKDTIHTKSFFTGADTVRTVMRSWDETYEVRHKVVAPYMRRITNNRVFFDYGDDNGNGTVEYSTNPEASEKLINGVDYYYAVRAFDEGDFLAGSSPKLNNKVYGLSNVVKTTPVAARPGNEASYTVNIPDADKARLGGIYNVRLLINDQQRFNQAFGGRTLQLEFFRSWSGAVQAPSVPTALDIGLYATYMTLRDSATQSMIGAWYSLLPPDLCGGVSGSFLSGYFTEEARTFMGDTNKVAPVVRYDTSYNQDGSINHIDSSSFGMPDSEEKVIRYGAFTSAADCLPNKYALGTVGIAFDYAIQQFGGVYRSLPGAEIIQGPASMATHVGRSNIVLAETFRADSLNRKPPEVNLFDTTVIPRNQAGEAIGWEASHNNGPGTYEIEFVEGGVETIQTTFLADPTREPGQTSVAKTFENVPYMKMKIRNVLSFTRSELQPDGTKKDVVVEYPFDLYETPLPYDSLLNVQSYPQSQRLPLDGFAVAAYGWRNARTISSYSLAAARPLAAISNNSRQIPVGLGKYYNSRAISTDGRDTLDFLHVLSLAGTQWTFDFSGMGRRNASIAGKAVEGAAPIALNFPTEDFKVGDKIRIKTAGGALGYPFDNTRVFFKVGTGGENGEYTDKQLDVIQVVPNPYYVTHEAIRSPFEGKLFFTHLPTKCTISIYTTSGSLVRVLEHDETTGVTPDKLGADVWDMLTKNGQRVVSQTLIAKIVTPNGASTIKKFSIIVGGARLTSDSGN